jgi:transaldolase
VNVTLCFSAARAIVAAKAGAYIVNYGYATQAPAASPRSPTYAIDSALAGSHIGTMPFKAPFKVVDMLFHHPLTGKCLEQFLKYWHKTFQEEPAVR